ncbi:Zinc finger protein ZPR1 [Zancudomyces culisetae]|uniref:Zinc finger protein ZPR1 n=1 Tax=Zancudomyces culisetae TaxID=1213189 RepID=A0A1R1PUR3_ZANCU|nr:Zinc finger protein ZPR1 [Zancudomyces culisetae]|eukprot:OMH84706.1 Zinc finger protein ZPR1 [Zancudomyces culisetae]
MNRQIVRNFSATVRIEELDMELPPIKSTRLTTVEGLLSGIIQDLEGDQPARREQSIEIYNAIENIIAKLKGYLRNEEPFLLTINDPSGNSYIESLQPPNLDPSLSMRVYQRTREQEIQLGMVSDEVEEDSSKPEQMDTIKEEDEEMKPVNEEVGAEEVITFHTNCHICNAPCETHMKQVDIPHFKNVIIMATNCDGCGYKSNEVKSGGAIADKGTKITLKLVCEEDLSRDILKSETCALSIPEINLHLTLGTLGGRFTTVEGLLRQVYDDLDRETPFSSGDSAVQERREKFRGFLQQLDDLIEGKSFPFNLILDDPASNSYLQNLYAPDNDPNMTIETYARNAEQNESLGLDTINVDHYAE